jgi:N-acetylmuramoyl-L-alanine amidase
MSQYLCPPLHDNGVKTDRQTAIGRQQGALTGSIFAKVPTVTVEMVYLSNSSDTAFIRSHAGQERMVEAMSAAILEYVRLQVTGEA